MGSSGSVRDSVAASSVDAVTCIESTGSIVGSTLVWNVCIGSVVVAVVEEDVNFGILDEDATSEEDVVFLITDIVSGGRREEIVAGVSEVRS